MQTGNMEMTENILNEFEFVWNPIQRKRAYELAENYGSEKVRVWLRHVLEGGARDMYDFVQKYRSRFNYTQLRGWESEDRESYYNNAKFNAQKISQGKEFDYIYCPFMKKRAMELIQAGEDANKLNSVLCYVLHGEDYQDHKVNEKAKLSYLQKMGVFP